MFWISVSFFFGLILTSNESKADMVHLGLRINYKTAMSHVEKKDLAVIEMLERIANMLPDSKFLISGHTDIVGDYDINIELSKGRANTVKLLMEKRNVSGDRIETKWFSYDAPIASNGDEEGRAKNRRTVATVYSLTAEQAEKLVLAAKKSKRFYIIEVENVKVDDYVTEVLEPQTVAQPEPVVLEPVVSEPIVEENEISTEPLVEPAIETPVEMPVKIKKIRKPSERHRYFLGWALTDNELVAERIGFKAIWVTDFNQSVSLGYQYKLTKKLWLGGSGAYSLQNYRIENNPIFIWDGATPDLMKVSANLDYESANRWALGFDVNYGEESFVISQGLNIFLEKVAILGVSGRGLYKFYDSENYSSRLKGLIEYPFAGSSSIKPKGGLGLMLGADVTLKKLFKTHEVNLGVFYGIRNFENIQNDQTENLIGFEVKIRNKRWP